MIDITLKLCNIINVRLINAKDMAMISTTAIRFKLMTTRWATRFIREDQANLQSVLVEMAKAGKVPWASEGIVMHHLAIEPTVMVSICIRNMQGNSPKRGSETLTNLTCRTCRKRWNQASDVAYVELVAEGKLEDAAWRKPKSKRELKREAKIRETAHRLAQHSTQSKAEHNTALDVANIAIFVSGA